MVQLHSSDLGTGSNQRLAQTVTDENGFFALALFLPFSFFLTSLAGWYQFTSLADGEYVVSFTIDDDLDFFDPYKGAEYNGWAWSPPNQGSDTAVDSNAVVEASNDNRGL